MNLTFTFSYLWLSVYEVGQSGAKILWRVSQNAICLQHIGHARPPRNKRPSPKWPLNSLIIVLMNNHSEQTNIVQQIIRSIIFIFRYLSDKKRAYVPSHWLFWSLQVAFKYLGRGHPRHKHEATRHLPVIRKLVRVLAEPPIMNPPAMVCLIHPQCCVFYCTMGIGSAPVFHKSATGINDRQKNFCSHFSAHLRSCRIVLAIRGNNRRFSHVLTTQVQPISNKLSQALL
jgi:hypothetical protein